MFAHEQKICTSKYQFTRLLEIKQIVIHNTYRKTYTSRMSVEYLLRTTFKFLIIVNRDSRVSFPNSLLSLASKIAV